MVSNEVLFMTIILQINNEEKDIVKYNKDIFKVLSISLLICKK